jgi:hypothetical protein
MTTQEENWFEYAGRCYERAADHIDALRHDLMAGLNHEQSKQLDALLGTTRQIEEITYHTFIEQVLEHLADPGRTFRAVYLHVVDSGTRDPSACCAEPPELPFNEEGA